MAAHQDIMTERERSFWAVSSSLVLSLSFQSTYASHTRPITAGPPSYPTPAPSRESTTLYLYLN